MVCEAEDGVVFVAGEGWFVLRGGEVCVAGEGWFL